MPAQSSAFLAIDEDDPQEQAGHKRDESDVFCPLKAFGLTACEASLGAHCAQALTHSASAGE